jgi:hypothetical protein
MRLEPLRPQQGVSQVKQQAERDEAGERVIENHGRSPSMRFRVPKTRRELKPFAGVGVADRGREEGEAEDHHENVQHEMLLYGVS